MSESADDAAGVPAHRKGRPRHYRLEPPAGFQSAEVAARVAEIAELRERVYDQIADLPAAAVNVGAPGGTLTIGWLAVHLIRGEMDWVTRAVGAPVPASVRDDPNLSRFAPYGTPPPVFGAGTELVATGQNAFLEHTLPALREIADPEHPTSDARLHTLDEVLRHLIWHWSFHSGHIGLVRLQAGGEYEWTFA